MNLNLQSPVQRGRTCVAHAALAAFSLAALAGCNVQLLTGSSDVQPEAMQHEGARSVAAPLESPPTWPTFATLPRYVHAGVELGSGQALVCGGKDNDEVYPPNCELLTSDGSALTSAVYPLPGDPVAQGRISLTLTLLPAGGVLLAGGRPGANNLDLDARASVPISNWLPGDTNPNQNWLPNEPMIVAREEHTATLLGTSVVVVGGYNRLAKVAEQMEVRTDNSLEPASWTAVGPAEPRIGHTATPLKPGAGMLVLGGYDAAGHCLSSGFMFSLEKGVQPIADMPSPRAYHTTTLLDDEDLLVVGGECADGSATAVPYFSDAWRYNPRTNTWSAAGAASAADDAAAGAAMATLPVARKFHSAVALGSYVIVAGGEGPGAPGAKSGQALQSVQSYDWKHNTWSDLRSLTEGREHFQLLKLGEAQLVASGGWRANGSDAPASSELITLGALGHSSTDATLCASGHAADGVCCDGDCNGSCETCDPSGVCQKVVSGAPVDGHPSCDGHLLCDAHGECSAQCDATNLCAAGYFCVAGKGTCTAEKGIGAKCDFSSECAADKPCVDGVCCKTLCDGSCETCNQAPNQGDCLPLAPGASPQPPPHKACSSATDGSALCAASCDGKSGDVCVCSNDDCVSGANCDAGPSAHCNVIDCNAKGYQCDRQADECRQTCQRSETDCAGGYYCHPLDHRCVRSFEFPAAELPSCAFGTRPVDDRGLVAAAAFWLLLFARRRDSARHRPGLKLTG